VQRFFGEILLFKAFVNGSSSPGDYCKFDNVFDKTNMKMAGIIVI